MAKDRNPNHAEDFKQVAQDVSEDMNRAARNVIEQAQKSGEQAAQAGADVAAQTAEAAQNTARTGVQAGAQAVNAAADRFTQALAFVGPQASQNVDALSKAGAALMKGAQELSQEWVRAVQDRLTKNVENLNRLTRCRSFQEFLTVQGEIARDRISDAVETSRRFAELSVRVGSEAAQAMQAQASRVAEQTRRAA